MTLNELRAEIRARGFDYITSNTRLNTLVNFYYHDICHRQAWPFLETTTSGVAPITISDFGNALSVVDTTAQGQLVWEDLRTLLDQDPSLSATGNPECWYMNGSALTVYPASSNTIAVRYLKVPTDLSADGDSPIIPSRFHYFLVDGVVSKLYLDDDEPDLAQSARQEYETGIALMGNQLLVPNYDSPSGIAPSWQGASSDW